MNPIAAVVALGVSAVLVVGAPSSGPGGGADIDEVIDREMPASGAPGLAYAVVEDGDIAVAGGRGVLRRGGEEPITPDTPFLTGSISKSFTAMSVLQLVEAGVADLDAPLSRYLDAFSGRPAGVITLRQLLSHTSGFSTLQGNAWHTDLTGARDELARRVEQVSDTTPAHAPGRRWEYSNTNYQLLGRVVEVVSGQDYQSYVTEHILEPIGMRHSFVADGEVHPSMATGHRPWFGTKRPLPENRPARGAAPQGGIVASANDLAHYLATMMNGQDDVLSASGKALMMRPAGEVSAFYGLGWFVDSEDETVWHSGTSPGYESRATMMPAEHRAVVVLVNAGSGVGFGETTQLRNGITAAVLGLDYDGEGSRLGQKILFVSLVAMPFVYLLSMVWAWRHRRAIRAKSGGFGLFSLWFPLLTTVVGAWVMLHLMPSLFGSPLGTIRLFQPDLGIALIATAVTGVAWAVFRLAVAYTGRAASLQRARPQLARGR